jgi:hypothetical protein
METRYDGVQFKKNARTGGDMKGRKGIKDSPYPTEITGINPSNQPDQVN